MSWIPRLGNCEICGEEVMMISASQRYCPDCRQIMKNTKGGEARKIYAAKRVARKRGTDPDRFKGEETECKHKGSCYYGSGKFCEYLTIEGHSRLFAGYPIRGGKCAAYKRGKRKKKKKLELPVAGSWNMRDLSEV